MKRSPTDWVALIVVTVFVAPVALGLGGLFVVAMTSPVWFAATGDPGSAVGLAAILWMPFVAIWAVLHVVYGREERRQRQAWAEIVRRQEAPWR